MMYKDKAYYHKEGSSWHNDTNVEAFQKLYKSKNEILDKLYEKLYDETIFVNPVH